MFVGRETAQGIASKSRLGVGEDKNSLWETEGRSPTWVRRTQSLRRVHQQAHRQRLPDRGGDEAADVGGARLRRGAQRDL